MLALSAATAVLVRADIAPTRYFGSGIAAGSGSPVRMERAAVEIVWGTPCTLTATFVMANAAGAPQASDVCFPLPADEGQPPPAAAPEGFSLAIDGRPVAVTPPGAGPEDRDEARNWVWYRGRHTFAPGQTTVTVRTPQRASLVYAAPYREALYYCLQSGGGWGGTIGEEEVVVRFPQPLEPGQIVSVAPAGGRIEGDCVRWKFKDFKPVGREYDIALVYVRPDVMQTVAGLRRAWSKQPDSAETAVKLASHLLALGQAKSNAGFPPSRLSKEQFETLRKKIAKAADRKAFAAHYRSVGADAYEAATTEWTDERRSMVRILAEAGYRDAESASGFVAEAERVLKDALARHPRDAAVWNAYLANYWRFSFAAAGHWFGPTWLGKPQARLIEQAAKNCPKDECIALWRELARLPEEKRDMTKLHEAMQRLGYLRTDFPKFDYGYY